MEAIRVIFPFSIYSSRDCCCFLLKYWISSRYKRIPLGAANVSSSATTSRISAVEAVVPLSRCRRRFVVRAMIPASVVFPTPEDRALYEYGRRFDGAELSGLSVTGAELEAALEQVEPEFLAVLREAADNIRVPSHGK